MHESSAIVLSVVVPFYNEAENLGPLLAQIDQALQTFGQSAEIIFANDGSSDHYEQPAMSPHFPVRWLDLSERSGQSAAMYFGMQCARGQFIGLLDADLQNDPADLPKLLAKLQTENLDLVTGVRLHRQDDWQRRFTSRLANRVRAAVLHDHTTDTGCSLKILRTELARRLPAWNGMHRFIPALAVAMGFHIGEMPVHHRSRHAGQSKVMQTKRALRATLDLLGMIWLTHRQFQGRLKS